MPGRISPFGKRRNAFGAALRRMRVARGLSATDVIAQLGVLGWEVAASSYSQLESGQRILADIELLLILKVLGAELKDLDVPKSLWRAVKNPK
ncbi:MAG: helix-turn-helix domain-containing protein [Chthoniobacterales bacterium]|nr:helix-turn-helix domain-containing protein [Chthoniobacterales bacterium]